jgi:hypothetical protein
MRLDGNEMVKMAVSLPKDMESLCAFMTEAQIKTFGDRVLALTTEHERDQEKFDDCVSEMRAFVRGGEYAMELLGRVYNNIIKHFGMEEEVEEIMAASGVYEYEGKLVRKGRKDDYNNITSSQDSF